MSFKSPLGKVRHLGADHKGTEEWISHRLFSLAFALITVWFFFAIPSLIGKDYEGFVTWLGEGANAILLSIFMVVMYVHTVQALTVVILDYVHHVYQRIIFIVALRIAFWFFGIFSVFTILKLGNIF